MFPNSVIQKLDQRLTAYFTPAAIADFLKRAPAVKRPIRDLVFSDAKPWPSVRIGLGEMNPNVDNQPVVRRDTGPVNLGGDGLAVNMIEPQPISLEKLLRVSLLLDWVTLADTSLQAVVEAYYDQMLRAVQKTDEALCAQALSGKIEYQMKVDEGTDTYVIDFGDPHTINFGDAGVKAWNDAGATRMDLYELLEAHHEKLDEAGYGDDVITLAGRLAFSRALNIVGDQQTKSTPIETKVEEGGITIGGYKIKRLTRKYKNAAGNAVPEIPDDKIVTVDTKAGHKHWHLALDKLAAMGRPTIPILFDKELVKRPDGMVITADSKPLPAPNVNAIVEGVVLQ